MGQNNDLVAFRQWCQRIKAVSVKAQGLFFHEHEQNYPNVPKKNERVNTFLKILEQL